MNRMLWAALSILVAAGPRAYAAQAITDEAAAAGAAVQFGDAEHSAALSKDKDKKDEKNSNTTAATPKPANCSEDNSAPAGGCVQLDKLDDAPPAPKPTDPKAALGPEQVGFVEQALAYLGNLLSHIN